MIKSVSLQAKILFGYLVLMAVIISMAAILFHERARLRELEADIVEIRQVRGELSEIHRNITVLASLGESVIAWEEEDYRAYQTRRLRVDSLTRFGDCCQARRGTCTKSCRCSIGKTKPTACLSIICLKLPGKRYNHVPSCERRKASQDCSAARKRCKCPRLPTGSAL